MLLQNSSLFVTPNYCAQELFSLSVNKFARQLGVTNMTPRDLETILSVVGFQLNEDESTYLVGPFSKESTSFLSLPSGCEHADDSKKISGYRICASSRTNDISLKLSLSDDRKAFSHGIIGVVRVFGSDSGYSYANAAQTIAQKVETAYKVVSRLA